MKRSLLFIIFFLLVAIFAMGFFIAQDNFLNNSEEGSDLSINEETPKPLLAYTFDNLKNTVIPESKITFGEAVEENDDYIRRMFYFETPAAPNSSEMKKVSGLATIPKEDGEYPIIVMFRGFIPGIYVHLWSRHKSICGRNCKSRIHHASSRFPGFW